MPTWDGFKYIVFACDDLSGWVEGKMIKECNSENVSKFLFEDVICRHGCPMRIVMDGGSENLDLTKALLERYRIKRTVISVYHPQSNSLVERSHHQFDREALSRTEHGRLNSVSLSCALSGSDFGSAFYWLFCVRSHLWSGMPSSDSVGDFVLKYGRLGLSENIGGSDSCANVTTRSTNAFSGTCSGVTHAITKVEQIVLRST